MRPTSREENPVQVCTRDIYMFLWDYAAIEEKKRGEMSWVGMGAFFRFKRVKIWFVPKTKVKQTSWSHPCRPSSLFRLENKLSFGGTAPCYTSQLKICNPPPQQNNWKKQQQTNQNAWMRRAVFWIGSTKQSFTEVSLQTFSVTWKEIYSDAKLSAWCLRELDDQYPMRKNKYRNAKQRWKGRRVAKVNWLTPFLAERH